MAGKKKCKPYWYSRDGYVPTTLETDFGADIEIVYHLEPVQPDQDNPSLVKVWQAESANTMICELVLVLNREAESRPEPFWLGAASVRRMENGNDWSHLISAIAAAAAEEAQKRLGAQGYDGPWRIGLIIEGGMEFFAKDVNGILRSVQSGAAIYYKPPVHERN